MKQVTVLGANGQVGRHVVAQLLARGYRVVAFVHRDNTTHAHENLKIFEGDIYDPEAVRAAIKGSEAVLSALGSWGTPKKDILEVGMIHTIGAMQAQGVKRIITLTGSEARAVGDKLSLIHKGAHFLAMLFAGKILRDGERHIALLETSGLDWTTVRSPIMNERSSTQYVLGTTRPLPWETVHRYAVASAIVNMLDDRSYAGQAPYISR